MISTALAEEWQRQTNYLRDRIKHLEQELARLVTHHEKVCIDYTDRINAIADKNKHLEQVVLEMSVAVSKCKDDHWFMINLIEKYSSNKEDALKDCLERMKFRKPLYEKQLEKHSDLISELKGKSK